MGVERLQHETVAITSRSAANPFGAGMIGVLVADGNDVS